MLHLINTIIPIFAVIVLGCLLRSRGMLPAHLLAPLNRIVYYFAIPAMIFREVAAADFHSHFNLPLLCSTLVPLVALFLVAFLTVKVLAIPAPSAGTFVQTSFHGNLGYIGLAVAFYFLGEDGLRTASMMAGFIMILQNLLAVLALQWFNEGVRGAQKTWFFVKKILGNPVVCSALGGMVFSILRIPVPAIFDRGLKILSGMALPMALLIIGASLSFELIRSHFKPALGSGAFKLILLPFVGLMAYRWLGIPATQFLPGLILLACPPATIAYVMASEMGGAPDLATAAVSMNTLGSCLTFIFWLALFV